METTFEFDSLNDSREHKLDRLEKELKAKNALLEEKSCLILEVRRQVEDRDQYISELKTETELYKQKIDKLTKIVNEKDEELEAISRYSQEIDTRLDTQTKKLEARTGQVKKLFDELTATKRELDESKSKVEEFSHMNQQLKVELDSNRFQRRSCRSCEDGDLANKLAELQRQNARLENKCRDLEDRLRHPSPTPVLAPPTPVMATPTPVLAPQPAREKIILRTTEKQPRFPIAEEQGEYLESQPIRDPKLEERMRMERAQELARRNKLTKPLHQTSYPLELDLYDTGPDTRVETITRKVLSPLPTNISRPIVRRPVKKAEAFIVV